MSSNPTVLILPKGHSMPNRAISNLTIRYRYLLDPDKVIVYAKELPNLKGRGAFHVYIEESNRIYHAKKLSTPPAYKEIGILEIELGNSWIPATVPHWSDGGVYNYIYCKLSEFGLAQVRPDVLITLDLPNLATGS